MSKPLTSDFVVQVGQIFPLQIVQLPELLTLQIIEGGTIKTTVLAEIKLPLCEPTKVRNICFVFLLWFPQNERKIYLVCLSLYIF